MLRHLSRKVLTGLLTFTLASVSLVALSPTSAQAASRVWTWPVIDCNTKQDVLNTGHPTKKIWQASDYMGNIKESQVGDYAPGSWVKSPFAAQWEGFPNPTPYSLVTYTSWVWVDEWVDTASLSIPLEGAVDDYLLYQWGGPGVWLNGKSLSQNWAAYTEITHLVTLKDHWQTGWNKIEIKVWNEKTPSGILISGNPNKGVTCKQKSAKLGTPSHDVILSTGSQLPYDPQQPTGGRTWFTDSTGVEGLFRAGATPSYKIYVENTGSTPLQDFQATATVTTPGKSKFLPGGYGNIACYLPKSGQLLPGHGVLCWVGQAPVGQLPETWYGPPPTTGSVKPLTPQDATSPIEVKLEVTAIGQIDPASWSRTTVSKSVKINPVFNLTYDTAGAESEAPKMESKVYGEKWGTPAPAPTKAGYTFLGWYDSSVNKWLGNKPATSDVNVTAYWNQDKYVMDFQSGLSGVPNPTSKVTTYGKSWGDLPKLSYPGYDFRGWTDAAYGGTFLTNDGKATKSLTAYGQWLRLSYTLNYVANAPGGGATMTNTTPIQKFYNDKWGVLGRAEKDGYKFLGWYTDPVEGTLVTSETVVTDNLTVYGHWSPISYNVTFDPNGQSGTVTGSMPSYNVVYNSGLTIPANKFVKSTGAMQYTEESGQSTPINSQFLGWSTDPYAKVPSLREGDRIDTYLKSTTLYAVWDDAPQFKFVQFPNRFFTLEQAQAGVITESELLSTVAASDRETNPLLKKTLAEAAASNDVGITLYNYSASDFTNLAADAKISLTYQVKDEVGNLAYLTVMVTVASSEPLPSPEVSYFRSISGDYVGKSAAKGGLSDSSLWRSDPTRKELLNSALSGAGKQCYTLTPDAVQGIRSHVATSGFGNSENPDSLPYVAATWLQSEACAN